MARQVRLPGKLWFKFKLFGLSWQARVIPAEHKELNDLDGHSAAFCCFDRRLLGFSALLTNEQLRTAFVHELEHAIEEHADVDHEVAAPPDVADRRTDQIARGWLYVIRECPEIVAMLRDEKPKGA